MVVLPGELDGNIGGNADDAARDLDLMLAPLKRLPEVESCQPGSSDGSDACDTGPWPRGPIEIRLTVEVAADAPHLAFIERLLGMVRRLVETDGVIATPRLLHTLGRIERHARCVAESWQQVRQRRSG